MGWSDQGITVFPLSPTCRHSPNNRNSSYLTDPRRTHLKTYLLEGVSDRSSAEAELSTLLPGQSNPWVLLASEGDAVAYFDPRPRGAEEDVRGPFLIHADASGRHYNEDEAVLRILRLVQTKLGGDIRDGDDNLL